MNHGTPSSRPKIFDTCYSAKKVATTVMTPRRTLGDASELAPFAGLLDEEAVWAAADAEGVADPAGGMVDPGEDAEDEVEVLAVIS
jgi:hypothetical protein